MTLSGHDKFYWVFTDNTNPHQAGTLFLGINDTLVGDNSGGFIVTVTGS
jgi:hypothetical protein